MPENFTGQYFMEQYYITVPPRTTQIVYGEVFTNTTDVPINIPIPIDIMYGFTVKKKNHLPEWF